MLYVPILPVYLFSVSVYSCIIFILDVKQTDMGEECNFEVNYFLLHISILLKTFILKKMSAKYAQQSMILTYQIFCVLNPWSLQGSYMTFYSLYQQIFRKIHWY